MHNNSMGKMNNEHSGNKEGLVISEMNCIQALAFDQYTIEGKDGFQSMGFEMVCLDLKMLSSVFFSGIVDCTNWQIPPDKINREIHN